MKRVCFVVIFGIFAICVCGCDSLRFAPSEVQKSNAWVHNRTAWLAVDRAKSDAAGGSVSGELVALASLSERQSRAFVADYGMPRELPDADTIDDVLSPANTALAEQAYVISTERPDTWAVVDAVIETGIALAGVLGGVWGIKASRFLRDARDRARALREIIEGNELFKRENAAVAAAFKTAHANQSPMTRQIVTAIKTE
jgi:hypothetical protein